MYTKNLEQLLRLLQASRQSGLLIVEPFNSQEAFWQGFFHLAEGKVAECQVCTKEHWRVQLRGGDAMCWMMAQGKLEWLLEEKAQFSDTIQPSLAANASVSPPVKNERGLQDKPGQPAWIPRRTQKGLMTVAQSLGSPVHLQVFTLVNGQNSVEGIMRLLRKSPHIVVKALEDLQRSGLIE